MEQERLLADAINRQAAALGVADRLRCLRDDVFRTIAHLSDDSRRWPVIMLAPPQYRGMIDRTLAALREHPLSAPGGLLICQHDSSETGRIDFLDFSIQQRRAYGNTTFTVVEA